MIDSEHKDFAVKAGRAQALKSSLAIIIFGTFWTAFTGIFVVAFFGPLFVGKEVHFESNGVPTVASPDNLEPILVPALIIGFFVLIGLAMLYWGFYSAFKKGGYFVGTPMRLIHYYKGNMRSIDWEQFSGDIEVNGNVNKGNVSLQMRTGKMVSRKNGPDRYIPDVIYMSKIPNAFEIERICRKRIKENDPTPPNI
jgi:hypothetical protein